MRYKNSKILLLTFSLTAAIFAKSSIEWGYKGEIGPDKWGDLSPKFRMCKEGKNQSPINLTRFIKAKLPAVEYSYNTKSTEVINNGHTIQVNLKSGSKINIDNIDFELKQFHFHTPSENKIDGKSFPLEAHFVHASKDGELAVVALMFEEGEENKVLSKIWQKMPTKADTKEKLEISDIKELLPKNKDYYRFNGSLTTPPCSEGVRWIVLKTPVTISKAQIDKFAKVMGHPNNRPIQPLNARVILE
ncbi:MAG: carbonic anhydrase family protein [Epsilonproteobacteria bacterium]|nr:carbonic anhydrase family protein [Campylobacterota bacterium]